MASPYVVRKVAAGGSRSPVARCLSFSCGGGPLQAQQQTPTSRCGTGDSSAFLDPPTVVASAISPLTSKDAAAQKKPKLAGSSKTNLGRRLARLVPPQLSTFRNLAFLSGGHGRGRQRRDSTPSRKADSPPLNTSRLEFSATRRCQALIQSPFRKISFKQQRRRLYRQEKSHSSAASSSSCSSSSRNLGEDNVSFVSDNISTSNVSALLLTPERTKNNDDDNKKFEFDCSKFAFGTATRKLLARRDCLKLDNSAATTVASAPATQTPQIGKGGFGSVYLARYNDQPVAIKKLSTRLSKRSLCAEMTVFRLCHPNIVRILAFTSIGDQTQVVYEYVGRRNLQQVLNDVEHEQIDFRRRFRYARKIAEALSYCHSMGVLHLDVKATNVLITDTGDECKLGDFGCSQQMSSLSAGGRRGGSATASTLGTLIYQSPELLRGFGPNTKADVYSYGFLLWQLLSRRLPFCSSSSERSGRQFDNAQTTIFLVVSSGLRPDCDFVDRPDFQEGDRQLMELAKLCWAQQTHHRPEFCAILKRLDAVWKQYGS